MDRGLSEMRVLVTGGARGIGRATARAFAEAGARVTVSDADAEALDETAADLKGLAGPVWGHATDVRDEASVIALVKTAADLMGELDVAVCNAGIYPSHRVLDMTVAQWDQVMEVNARGVFLVAREAARHMVNRKTRGHILTISSGSHRFGRIGSAHYCASKAAVVMFTRVLAMELAPHRIQVNSVAPGLILVPGIGAEYVEAFSEQIPWGRPGRPEEVASACLMLAASDCRYITGQVIGVDGGATAGRYGLLVDEAPGTERLGGGENRDERDAEAADS